MARLLGRLRISRDKEQSTRMAGDRDKITKWSAGGDHTLVGFAEDGSVSGAVPLRETPGLGPWLTDRLGEWDILVCTKIDRLARSVSELSTLAEWAKDNGKTLVFIDDNIDLSSASGKFLFHLLSAVAEFERAIIQARILDERARNRATGSYHGGPYPYGYRPVKRDGGGWTLELHPEHAQIVRQIFRRVTETSVSEVCRELTADGIPSPKGGEWKVSTLVKMIRSRVSVGYVEHNGQLVIGEDGNPVRREPLVTEQEQERAIAAITEGRRPSNRKFETALLSGIVVCGKCEQPMHTARTTVKGKDYAYYKCSHRAAAGNRVCNAGMVRQDYLDPIAERLVSGDIGHVRRMERVRVSGGDQRVIADLTQQIKDLTAAMAATDDDDDDLAEQISALKARRKAARSVGDVWDVRPIEDGRGATWGEYWATLESVQDKRNLMAELGAELSALRTGKGLDVGFKLLDRHQAEGTLIVAASEE